MENGVGLEGATGGATKKSRFVPQDVELHINLDANVDSGSPRDAMKDGAAKSDRNPVSRPYNKDRR